MTSNNMGKIFFVTKPAVIFFCFLLLFSSTLIAYVAVTAADRFFNRIRAADKKSSRVPPLYELISLF